MAGVGGRLTPANNGDSDVTGRITPPFGIHHFLSPVFMSYPVTPPICFGFRIDTPPMFVGATARPEPTSFCTYPGGGGSAPSNPQLSCIELYLNSEHGSFWSTMVPRPLCPPTNNMPVSGSAAAPPSMFTPPLAPGAYHEHL